VYNTNHTNIEKALLGRENMQQTVRILLNNGMQDTDAELSAVFQELQEQCPTLFDTLLPRSEQNVDRPVIDEEEVQFISSNMHRRPTATGYIPSSFIRTTLKLPVRISDLDKNEHFSSLLTTAYMDSYKHKNVEEFGSKWLSWFKKVGFTDRYVAKETDFIYVVDISTDILTHITLYGLQSVAMAASSLRICNTTCCRLIYNHINHLGIT
jgi:hypothetical protein